jgi:hypothetical protein
VYLGAQHRRIGEDGPKYITYKEGSKSLALGCGDPIPTKRAVRAWLWVAVILSVPVVVFLLRMLYLLSQ